MKLSWPRGPIGSPRKKRGKQATPVETQNTALEAVETAEDPQTGAQRRCLVSREHAAREVMLRFVVGPEAALVFDITATLPGRGMWLLARGDVIELACKNGVFARAAKQNLRPPPDLAAKVEMALMRRVSELLGLARRAGSAISGFEKAREWLAVGKAGLVVQAFDGSAEERARFMGASKLPVVAPLDAAALGRVFGREHAVHVAVAPGRLARMIEVEAVRLAGVAGGRTSGHIAPLSNGPD